MGLARDDTQLQRHIWRMSPIDRWAQPIINHKVKGRVLSFYTYSLRMRVLMEKHKIPILFDERIFMDTKWFSNTLTNFSKCFMCKIKA